MKRLLKFLLCVLPAVLYFSFWPVIRLGGNESMNFEFSLPLVWLVVFDAMGLVMLVRERKLFDWVKGRRWMWLLFPVWLTLSVVWSLNPVRGVLTAGIMWLLYLAGYVIWVLREGFDEMFRMAWWKWFMGATMVACLWCAVQCVLDLVGVSQEYSLMCDGCTYRMFGFPHPNGFAIEPQFMGNLLLAPAIMAAWFCLEDNCNSVLRGRGSSRPSSRGSDPLSLGRNLRKPLRTLLPVVSSNNHDDRFHSLCSNFLLVCFFIFTATLFLTFSRGAIYAFVVGMLFVSGLLMFSAKKRERGVLWKRIGTVWGLVVLSFVMVLNLQGLMAEVGPTNDTYFDGVAKVVNHLSLGVIDLRASDVAEGEIKTGNTEGELLEDRFEVVENHVENFEENVVENFKKEEAVFDGYVAESTDTRVRLSGAAVAVWSQNPSNMLFGVGLGGAGYALYNNGLSPAPKEIVQNEYASLLLETGLIGVSLFVLTLILAMRVIWKLPQRVMMIGLLVAYGVSLMFFSGLPNALHIYLLPVVLLLCIAVI